MKNLIFYFLLFLTVSVIGCANKEVHPLLEKVHYYEVDNARWNEKKRWFRYIGDSIQGETYQIRLKVAIGLMTPKQGFESLLKLIDKADTPFYK